MLSKTCFTASQMLTYLLKLLVYAKGFTSLYNYTGY